MHAVYKAWRCSPASSTDASATLWTAFVSSSWLLVSRLVFSKLLGDYLLFCAWISLRLSVIPDNCLSLSSMTHIRHSALRAFLFSNWAVHRRTHIFTYTHHGLHPVLTAFDSIVNGKRQTLTPTKSTPPNRSPKICHWLLGQRSLLLCQILFIYIFFENIAVHQTHWWIFVCHMTQMTRNQARVCLLGSRWYCSLFRGKISQNLYFWGVSRHFQGKPICESLTCKRSLIVIVFPSKMYSE